MLTGFFEGNTPSDLTAAQTWLGSNVSAVTAFTGQASWSDYTGSVGYEQGLWSGTGKTMLWSIPLFANGGDLHDAGAGAYDSYYKQVAAQLVSGQSTGAIYVRTGWEFNGNWETWSAQGSPSSYIAAFRDFVTAFRSVSNRFVFTWTPNIGNQGMNPAAAYPGDKYVDIIGMDAYQQGSGQTFSSVQTEQYGLNWLTSFAAAHNKPIAIPEWGVDSDTSGGYVQQMAAWMNAHNVAYESYWDSNSGYQGKLSGGQYGDTGAAFIQALGAPSVVSITAAANTSAKVKIAAAGAAAPSLATGQGATISVHYNTAVQVAGTPVLLLNDGEVATYTGAASSTVLNFSYTAGAGHQSADLQVTGLSLPQGAAITGAMGGSVATDITGDLGLAVTMTLSANITTGLLSGAGAVQLGSSTLTVEPASGASAQGSFSGTMAGTGRFVMMGTDAAGANGGAGVSQVQTLAHTDNFTGGAAIEGGTLELAALHAAGTGAVTFTNSSASVSSVLQIDNAALTGAGGATESFSNLIKGMAGSDIIDLRGLAFDAASPGGFHVQAGGALEIDEGGTSVQLMTDLHAKTEVYAFEDAHGGTYLSLNPMADHDPSHYHP